MTPKDCKRLAELSRHAGAREACRTAGAAGRNAGLQFWSCCDYPNCKGAVNV